MKKEANKKLEIAVMRGDTFMVSCALSEGASIGYKSGAFFANACREGSIEIVEMFLLDPTFVEKGKRYQKELSISSFDDGLSYAVSNNRQSIVELLINSTVYKKLNNIETSLLRGLGVNKSNIETLNYIFKETSLYETEEFKNQYKDWSEDYKSFIDCVVLQSKLEKNLETKKISIKIKI